MARFGAVLWCLFDIMHSRVATFRLRHSPFDWRTPSASPYTITRGKGDLVVCAVGADDGVGMRGREGLARRERFIRDTDGRLASRRRMWRRRRGEGGRKGRRGKRGSEKKRRGHLASASLHHRCLAITAKGKESLCPTELRGLLDFQAQTHRIALERAIALDRATTGLCTRS